MAWVIPDRRDGRGCTDARLAVSPAAESGFVQFLLNGRCTIRGAEVC